MKERDTGNDSDWNSEWNLIKHRTPNQCKDEPLIIR